MDSVKMILDKSGISTHFVFTQQHIDNLIKKANELERKELLLAFGQEMGNYFLYDWKSFIQAEKVDEELYKRVNIIITSVEIYYNTFQHKIEYQFDYDYFYENYPYDCDLFEEYEPLMFLSPQWELSSMFMSEKQKETASENLVIQTVKNIVEQTSFLDDLYNKVPEAIKEGAII